MKGHRLAAVIILVLVACLFTAGGLAQTSLGGVKES